MGRVPCSVGAWDGVERPHCVASVSQPCLCPYGVREKVLRCRIRELRANVSAWYKYFRVVFSHPLGNSLRVGTLWVARYDQMKKYAGPPLGPKARFGKNRIYFPDVPHRTRHVPGVIKHGPEVFFTRYDVYSHLRPNSFTPRSISQRSCSAAREKSCRSTPDASVSVLDASWAPQTPISAMGML